MYQDDKTFLTDNCFSKDLNIIERQFKEAYEKQNHVCFIDSSCPAFEYCVLNLCPQIGWAKKNNFFAYDALECAVAKTCYQSAIKLLSIGNDLYPDNILYKEYLKSLMLESSE